MSDRLIQIVAAKKHVDTISDCFEDLPEKDWYCFPAGEDDRQVIIAALDHVDMQDVLDKIAEALDGQDGWTLHALTTEASLPEVEDEDETERVAQEENANAREEIYSDIRQNTALTVDYLVMTGLATVVAAIGLLQDQVAVVIGAMVIAPLLGPILAFAFATTLGTVPLMWIALRALGAGLGVGVAAGVALGFVVPFNGESSLMAYDGSLSLMTVALPLASGAAAALMVAGGQTSGLVGVMVAAALLPPLAAFGLLLGNGSYVPAVRALATVVINIAAINLAALAVFRVKGVRPRDWQSDTHQTSIRVSFAIAAAVVALLGLAVYAAEHGWLLFGG
ncbi:TIGR00341 family protein [Maritimibacter sp. UBA3975]|uniref:TIGR00341 family protein n=1 Tax=Maritimibacter sp. UBA3975 TaxID=1946833 RepID=UPI000C0B6983|nr:TIGR00341 family protein [Maritimibacter sp. UBA3975]MAM63541.1 TIGR00341 family protein [Maritimibacter sp.]|tara:strand:+ start:65139 stop:66146 length:1008 start_codon:yes stop_codon:yes gene_type:complete